MSKVLLVLAPIVVGLILLAGIVVMAIGGETNRKWSNTLMRYRVIAQAVAVAVLFAVIYMASQH
jgi:hypothetical protein